MIAEFQRSLGIVVNWRGPVSRKGWGWGAVGRPWLRSPIRHQKIGGGKAAPVWAQRGWNREGSGPCPCLPQRGPHAPRAEGLGTWVPGGRDAVRPPRQRGGDREREGEGRAASPGEAQPGTGPEGQGEAGLAQREPTLPLPATLGCLPGNLGAGAVCGPLAQQVPWEGGVPRAGQAPPVLSRPAF